MGFEKAVDEAPDSGADRSGSAVAMDINASGHRQELDRNFGLLSICGLAVTSGNTWLALGGSIVS